MSLLLPTDNCGNCLTAARSVTARADAATTCGSEIRAAYHCPECGHRWNTSWLVSALDASQPRRTA